MINKKLNLSLKLNNSFSSLGGGDQPFTPLEQTMKTPLDQPMLLHTPQHHPGYQNGNHNGNMDYFTRNDSNTSINSHTLYQNPHYNESDDILTDIDEPLFGSFKTTKNYTVNFNQNFDQLLLSTYQYFLGLPTTTPFLGTIPPSGLVSKVSNDTMSKLIQSTSSSASSNPPSFDHQNIVSHDFLRNHSYKPIFLQLIRKRLIDLCSCHQNGLPLPQSTSITITVTSGGGNGMPFTTTTTASNSNNGMPPNIRQSSISNLSLTELNISNYNAALNGGTKNSAVAAAAAMDNRSRSSSISLRKQSLTRNNSYSGNNWLHVGNLNTIKPEAPHSKFSTMHNDNLSTDSLQSIQDYVPQSFINKSGTNNSTNTSNGNSSLNNNNNNNSLHPSLTSSNGFNSMMMDYQTPPSSQKGSISHQITPPSNSSSSHQIFNSGNENMVDDFSFYLSRSRSSSRGTTLPKALHINTDAVHNANSSKNGSFSSASSINGTTDTLDSPFMSSSKTSDDCGYFTNGFPVSQNGNIPHSPMYDNDNSSISSASSTGSLRGTGIATVISGATPTLTTVTNSPGSNGSGLNSAMNASLSSTGTNPPSVSASTGAAAPANKDSINLPSQFSLSEKKRDSLKLKRGIH